MNAIMLRNRRPLAAWTAVALVAVAACDRGDAPIGAPPPSAGLAIGIEVSALDAPRGDRVTVAVRASADEPLAGLQGYLRFDPTRLRYVGQVPDGVTLAITNESAADRGELRVLSMKVDGLPTRTAVYVFAVLGAGYDRGLGYELELGATVDQREMGRAAVAARPSLAADLAPAPEGRRLTLADWDALLYPDVASTSAPPGLALSPGQYLLNLRYGDARLDNSVNILDASYIANAAVGNNQIIVGTDSPARDAVVAGNVRPANNPGLGEPSDANPPGRDASGGRSINILDALAIANEAVGNPQDIVGELVPGRGPITTNRVMIAAGSITADRTFLKDTIYELQGIVRVNGGATLTIQPGTRIEGNSGQVSALFIERDGRIVADGTPLEPITMTCTAVPKTKGCWGGLWIAGNAPLNDGTLSSPVIPGRAATGGCFEKQGEGNAPLYGGCNPDDSSGVVRYVVEEYSGFILSPNNELNGISLGGVGRRTVIENVQIHAGLDDGIEFFGGTVNVKNLVLTANSDDAFDISFGWSGNAQFVIVQSDSLDGDKGIEADNTEAAATFEATPVTNPQLFNFTFVGEASPTSTSGAAGNNVNDALHLRRGTAPQLHNAIVMSYTRALDADDAATCTAPEPEVASSILAGMVALGNTDTGDPVCSGAADEGAFLQLPAKSNQVVASAAGILVSPFNVVVPDFRPAATLPGGVSLAGATPPANGFFDVTATFIGAVPQANSTGTNIPWYSGWTRGWQSATTP